jgi:hypothetical protein
MWVSVHAFYHGNLDLLLLDAVRPLVQELRQRRLIDGFFFLRYWDGGQHLRLRLLAESTMDREVERLALERLRGFVEANPAEDFAELDRYPEYAATFAAAEGVTEYLRTPMTNNTVHVIEYQPETDRYGVGEALSAVERHFVESSRIALGLIGAGLTRDQRHTVALSALLLAWRAGEPRRAEPAPEFEPRYLAMRDTLHTIANRMAEIAGGTSALPASGALSSWWRSINAVPDRRVTDICAHLLCNRLGLSIADERYVRYLAARTAAETLRPTGER